MSGDEVCLIPMDEARRVQSLTGRLRTSPLPLFRRLRQLFREKGVDVERSYLVQLFPDGPPLDFGILVTSDGEIFHFDFDYGGETEGEGHFRTWRPISDLMQEHWRQQIEIGLALLTDQPSQGSCAILSPASANLWMKIKLCDSTG